MTTETRRFIVMFCYYLMIIIFILSNMPAYNNQQETFGPAYIAPSESTERPSESSTEATEVISSTECSVTVEPTETTEQPTETSTEAPSEEVTEPSIEDATEVETEPELQYFDVPLEKDLQRLIFELCEKRGIDPAIIVAMIFRESSFRSNIIGDSGNSYGLMQIQPKWNRDRMNELGCNNLLDPYQNVKVGIDCFADYYDQSGSITWALMAYNGGPTYANRLTREGRVSQYAKNVLSYAETIRIK